MTSGALIALSAVLLALVIGCWRALTDGHFVGRGAPSSEESTTPATPSPGAELVSTLGVELGERATLLQFSSAFCAPCRTTRVVLADVAGAEDGVAHVDVDAEAHLDAVRRLGILRTPTTLVLDRHGAEVARAAGVPTRDQVRGAVERASSHDVDGRTGS